MQDTHYGDYLIAALAGERNRATPHRYKLMKFHCKFLKVLCFREDGSRSKSRYLSDTIISGTSSIDRRSHGKSMDRKSSDSDYSGSGSRKSSNDRRLSASRHSLISRGSDL